MPLLLTLFPPFMVLFLMWLGAKGLLIWAMNGKKEDIFNVEETREFAQGREGIVHVKGGTVEKTEMNGENTVHAHELQKIFKV